MFIYYCSQLKDADVFVLRNASKREKRFTSAHVKAHNLKKAMYWVGPQPHTPISRSVLY